jgi:CesT_Tir_1
MVTRDDLESFFIRMGADAEEVDEGMWVVRSSEQGGVPVVMHYSPPVLLLRLKVMDLPEDADDNRLGAFYRRLLELNATDIVHGNYGIEGNDVVLSDALELETLDFLEVRSSYESLALAASSHMQELVGLLPVAQET